jgi:hypothetical protein
VKEFDLVKSKIEARDNGARDGPIKADFEKKQTICIWLLFWEG